MAVLKWFRDEDIDERVLAESIPALAEARGSLPITGDEGDATMSGLWTAGALLILTACLVGTIWLAAHEPKRANRDEKTESARVADKLRSGELE